MFYEIWRYIYFSHAKTVEDHTNYNIVPHQYFFSWHDTKTLGLLAHYAKKSSSKDLDKDPTATYFLAD